MEDHSSSSPPNTAERLTEEQGLSGFPMGELDSSFSQFQPLSHNGNAPYPRTPLLPQPIPSSESGGRGMSFRQVVPDPTSTFGSNYLPPPENSTMFQEMGHQENPTNDTIAMDDDSMHPDPPLSSEYTGQAIMQPPFASNPLPPLINSPEIQDNAPELSSQDIHEMIQELYHPEPQGQGQLFLSPSETHTNAVQDLRFGTGTASVLPPSTLNVPQTQIHCPYGTSEILTEEQGFSGLAMGKLETQVSSSSKFQPHSHNDNAPSPRMLPSPPPPPIPSSESGGRGMSFRPVGPNPTSTFGSNYLPSPENPTMFQEMGHQENPTNDTIAMDDDSMHLDRPLSSEYTGQAIMQPPFASNPLPPPINSPEIQDNAPELTSEDLHQMIQELLHSEPQGQGQPFLPPSDTHTNAVQDLRFATGTASVLPPLTSNVPQTQTHCPYGTSRNMVHQFGNHPGSVNPIPASVFSNAYGPAGPSAVNNQDELRRQHRQLRQQMIGALMHHQQRVLNNIWDRPQPGHFLLNVAVYMLTTDLMFVGAVIRDHAGAVHAVMMRRRDSSTDQNPAQTDRIIFSESIAFSSHMGYNRIIAETERHSLVQEFQSPDALPSGSQFAHFQVRLVSRNGNSVAHLFARIATAVIYAIDHVYWNGSNVEDVLGSNLMPF